MEIDKLIIVIKTINIKPYNQNIKKLSWINLEISHLFLKSKINIDSFIFLSFFIHFKYITYF